ncbi:hypothetical protein [Halalkalicoccus ordinarius]|uniref:hypothetical protein n=1 Tax=Halalkalicoccus ordinarius TaxID=3116651 RepID=UPI00300EF262
MAVNGSNSGTRDRELEQSNVEVEPTDDHERRAEEFFGLEAALRRVEGVEDAPAETRTTGTITAVRRTSAVAVPETYPDSIETSVVLAFDVRTNSGDEAVIYVEWPETFTAETPLARLLSSLDISPGSFADLYGAVVPLSRVDGRYVLDLPSSPATDRSPRWVYAIVACLVGWGVAWLANPSGGLILLVWTLLPLATYLDLGYVREASDWEPHRLFWPLLAAVWIVNVPVGVLYLYKRVRALGPFWR